MGLLDHLSDAEIVDATGRLKIALPPTIGVETWEPGDCNHDLDDPQHVGCRVVRIYDRAARSRSMTDPDVVHIERTVWSRQCKFHAGLSHAELHATHDAETQIRARTHRKVEEDHSAVFDTRAHGGLGSDGGKPLVAFAWEGAGKERTLLVVAPALTDEQHADLAAWAAEERAPTPLRVKSGVSVGAAKAIDLDAVAKVIARKAGRAEALTTPRR